MSAERLWKLSRYIADVFCDRPLWERSLPQYPLHWKGNPQFRVLLPLFWMKMVKSESKLPPGAFTFHVHPQMTRFDVKNYLEKIYNVPVLHVRTALLKGEERRDPLKGYDIDPAPDKRIAFVQLDPEIKFEFPDLFKERGTETEKMAKQYKDMKKMFVKEEKTSWTRSDVPAWFR